MIISLTPALVKVLFCEQILDLCTVKSFSADGERLLIAMTVNENLLPGIYTENRQVLTKIYKFNGIKC